MDDPRYTVMDAEDYWLVCTATGVRTVQPLYGVVDNEDGLIAYAPDAEVASAIAEALESRALTSPA